MWTCVWSASGRYGRHGSKCSKPKNWTLEGHFLPFGSFCMGIQAHTTRRGRMVLGLPCVIPQPAIRVTTRIRTILAIELPKNFGILHSLASCVFHGFSSQHGTWRFQDSHGDFEPAKHDMERGWMGYQHWGCDPAAFGGRRTAQRVWGPREVAATNWEQAPGAGV